MSKIKQEKKLTLVEDNQYKVTISFNDSYPNNTDKINIQVGGGSSSTVKWSDFLLFVKKVDEERKRMNLDE